jgi:hypothetical protein
VISDRTRDSARGLVDGVHRDRGPILSQAEGKSVLRCESE